MSKLIISISPGDSIIRLGPPGSTDLWLATLSGDIICMGKQEFKEVLRMSLTGKTIVKFGDAEGTFYYPSLCSDQFMSSVPIGLNLVKEYTELTGLKPNVPVFHTSLHLGGPEVSRYLGRGNLPEPVRAKCRKYLLDYVCREVNLFFDKSASPSEIAPLYKEHIGVAYRDGGEIFIDLYSGPFYLEL